ncbi:unnamed protein product [Phyllotreta striolata]|uniref:Uncharacterized protein n=1 Tax=Phyllotreta striolata TaxID=444603 RepID=A0A9N9TS84_PHYSR|nr:unnamed protein product [Phyllotreta striolata]
MSVCSGECDILYENLVGLQSLRDESDYERELVKCIKHHEEIRKLVRNIEKRFSLIILEQYFTSLISCCTTMFKLSLAEPMSMEFFRTLSYQLNIFLQMYLFCWCASEVTEKV